MSFYVIIDIAMGEIFLCHVIEAIVLNLILRPRIYAYVHVYGCLKSFTLFPLEGETVPVDFANSTAAQKRKKRL